jgi:hypothetical protein
MRWETIREDVGLTVLVEQDGDALVVSASGALSPIISKRSPRSYESPLRGMAPK